MPPVMKIPRTLTLLLSFMFRVRTGCTGRLRMAKSVITFRMLSRDKLALMF